jgi:hypothetical protein
VDKGVRPLEESDQSAPPVGADRIAGGVVELVVGEIGEVAAAVRRRQPEAEGA